MTEYQRKKQTHFLNPNPRFKKITKNKTKEITQNVNFHVRRPTRHPRRRCSHLIHLLLFNNKKLKTKFQGEEEKKKKKNFFSLIFFFLSITYNFLSACCAPVANIVGSFILGQGQGFSRSERERSRWEILNEPTLLLSERSKQLESVTLNAPRLFSPEPNFLVSTMQT